MPVSSGLEDGRAWLDARRADKGRIGRHPDLEAAVRVVSRVDGVSSAEGRNRLGLTRWDRRDNAAPTVACIGDSVTRGTAGNLETSASVSAGWSAGREPCPRGPVSGLRPASGARGESTAPFEARPHRSVDDAVTIRGSDVVRASSASFRPTDVDKPLRGVNVPRGTTIVSVVSAGSARLSGAATGSCDREVLTIGLLRDAQQQAIYRATYERGFMSDALHPSQLGHDDIAHRVEDLRRRSASKICSACVRADRIQSPRRLSPLCSGR